ncbi:aminopeptidase N isoform X2 [Ischnura elegans]|nr:aminopeptidase N isoform X2 [Ischnura elegans]
MSQSREALAMNASVTTFGKKKGFLVSRCTAFFLLLAALLCLAATGLLVYHLAPCSRGEAGASALAADSSAEDGDYPAEGLGVGGGAAGGGRLSPHAGDAHSAGRAPRRLDVRLPRSVLPHRYDLRLVPLGLAMPRGASPNVNFTFHGEVRILVNVTEATKNVTLHVGDDMRVDEAYSAVDRVPRPGERMKRVPVARHETDAARNFHVVHLEENLEAGRQYEVHLKFSGILNDLLQGFYRSSYSENNKTRWIATTQFQPTDARRAFPCFDEPALKARFKISIARPHGMSAISNMPHIQGVTEPVVDMPGWVWEHFMESVPMSTYLVAFVVCDFERRTNGSFSVWARREAINQAQYSLHVGPAILKHFENYFGVTYPLPKVDMIALPDFAAGAMENWGLITYRETAMLYQRGVSTNSNKQRVATVVSHELAHQWFGNLVTPSWWTDLWLNEGFASYVEYLGVEAVEPSWKITEQFVVDELQNVFALDALESSHPISIEVGHPDEINEIFDRISYGKGASIIRMMDHFLTTSVFKKGLTNYLKSRAYQSATQNDLWDALTAQAHRDGALERSVSVKEIMDTWTLQMGFPVVTVIRDYEKATAKLTQERFLLRKKRTGKSVKRRNQSDAQDSEKEYDNYLWWIPITFTSQDAMNFWSTHPQYWMKMERSITLTSGLPPAYHWVIFNIQETGFYRVNYDPTNWKMLIAQLESDRFTDLNSINRAQLLDDALNLARAGLLDYGTALSVTRYLSQETEYLPWKAAFSALGYIDSMLVRTGGFEKFKSYMLSLIDNIYKQTGFSDSPRDEQLTVYKRVSVLGWACSLGHEDCVQNCIKQYNNWRRLPNPDKNNTISPNLKNVIYCTAIRHGSQAEWEFAWERYRATNVGSEKDLLLAALGCSRETWILIRYLEWSVTENSGIRKQDAARVFAAVSSNVMGQPLAFNFLREKWDKVKEYLGSSLFTINNIVRSSTKRMNTEFELADLKKFAADHRKDLGTATRAVEQAMEKAEANVEWMKTHYQTIIEWLSNATNLNALNS